MISPAVCRQRSRVVPDETPDTAISDAFRAFIGRAAFPCVGAKAAVAIGNLRVIRGGDMRAPDADARITRHLQAFAARTPAASLFVSLAIAFDRTAAMSEQDFETALWERLQSIHEIDSATHAWDPTVSDDPASPWFSMSVGGRAFYVVGMHPASVRRARRFSCPVLVFNLHDQFERLRADGRYDKLAHAITQRDIAFSGSRNPMLAVHGTRSEARQYSGRKVDAAWRCPFRPMRQERQ